LFLILLNKAKAESERKGFTVEQVRGIQPYAFKKYLPYFEVICRCNHQLGPTIDTTVLALYIKKLRIFS